MVIRISDREVSQLFFSLFLQKSMLLKHLKWCRWWWRLFRKCLAAIILILWLLKDMGRAKLRIHLCISMIWLQPSLSLPESLDTVDYINVAKAFYILCSFPDWSRSLLFAYVSKILIITGMLLPGHVNNKAPNFSNHHQQQQQQYQQQQQLKLYQQLFVEKSFIWSLSSCLTLTWADSVDDKLMRFYLFFSKK